MPIYEFTCSKCGRPTEVMQRVGDRPPPCPYCGSKRMARAVSRTAFHLKGGGWYADLYATPRPGEKKGDAIDSAKTKDEKPAATEKATVAATAAEAPPAGEKPAEKNKAASTAAPGPPRRRPAAPRKRR
jgi:putative FmdB family regulatory protein